MPSNQVLLRSIEQQLDDFVLHSPKNIVADLDSMRIYDQPLVAVRCRGHVLDRLKQRT